MIWIVISQNPHFYLAIKLCHLYVYLHSILQITLIISWINSPYLISQKMERKFNSDLSLILMREVRHKILNSRIWVPIWWLVWILMKKATVHQCRINRLPILNLNSTQTIKSSWSITLNKAKSFIKFSKPIFPNYKYKLNKNQVLKRKTIFSINPKQ